MAAEISLHLHHQGVVIVMTPMQMQLVGQTKGILLRRWDQYPRRAEQRERKNVTV